MKQLPFDRYFVNVFSGLMKLLHFTSIPVLFLVLPLWALADEHEKEAQAETDESKLTIERIFDSKDFDSKSYVGKWKEDSSGYYRSKKSAETDDGRDIVLIDPESGNEQVVVAAQDLIPPGQSSPLKLDAYTFSEDESKLLIYTNSKRVWRRNSRGDYWVLDQTGLGLKQIGAQFPPASLMHAKLSPDGTRAG